MKKHFLALITITLWVVVLLPLTTKSQSKNVSRETFYWLRYSPSFGLGNDWTLKGEIEIRRFVFPDRQHQLLIPRMTFVKRLPNGWDAGAGALYLLQALPQDAESDIALTRPEIRPHQELIMKDSWGAVGVSHRYRLEERFRRKTEGDELVSGYDFNFRFRYRLQFAYPLNKKEGAGELALKLYDEVMVNFGEQVVRNTFDQNRIYLGLDTQLSKQSSLEAGLMNWFQQQSSGDDFRSRYILRITFSQSF